MKALRNKSGDVISETMTVAELREFLAKYPADMPVFAELDGMYNSVCEIFENAKTVKRCRSLHMLDSRF